MHSDTGAPCRGQYFDGESALAHDVVVRCTATVLEAARAGEVVVAWTYSDLLAPDPVISGRPARITHASAPYARIVVDEPDFADLILQHAPHLSSRAHGLQTAKIVGICMLIAVAFVAISYLFLTYAPRTVAGVMPDSWRKSLGAQVEQLLVGSHAICTAPDGVAALEAIKERLTTHGSDPTQFKVQVYDMPIINAFALPGGTIVISHKLIVSSEGPEGVTGVLAHEMGHVIERDSEAQLVRSLGISVIQQVLFGGSSGMGDAVGGIAGFLTLVSYTREAERRADRHANAFLEAAAVDPDGLIKFFELIKEKQGGASQNRKKSELGSLFSTHPGLTERIETLRDAPKWESQPVLDEQQWTALKEICSTSTKGAVTTPSNDQKLQ